MKTRFSSLDVAAVVTELQKIVGLRLNQVYDVDSKTYLLKFTEKDGKVVLLFESGARIHTTSYEWPKNVAPSGFSMKLRKHLKNKRLESVTQLGADRIVQLQFGMGEVCYYIIIELFDRGNIVLADHEMTIVNVLRPHTEGDKVRFCVKEKYPLDRARPRSGAPSLDQLKDLFSKANPGDHIKKILIPNLDYGPALLDHVLVSHNLSKSIWNGEPEQGYFDTLVQALQLAEEMMSQAFSIPSRGYIIEKANVKPDGTELLSSVEFHPFLFKQHETQPHKEFESFNEAVDNFFSGLESQKIDLRALHLEREALKKVERIRANQAERVKELEKCQSTDKQKAELIMCNSDHVESAIQVIRSAIASQLSWEAIGNLVAEAARQRDPVGSSIKKLKLEENKISMYLDDPYATEDGPSGGVVDIDLALSAFANAEHYFGHKKSAAVKQAKTVEAQTRALKVAEKKAKQVVKEVQTMTTINKARKSFWFEKFFWFISSENYLVIGGRDQQQNELLVKRYLKAGDLYVHADVQGASSVIVKNPSKGVVPPKTLNEAGVMAVCYSLCWETKVMCGAWWVHHDQVSKTAPSGEYLTSGSFMIRGTKNYILPAQLALGFGFFFRVEESFVEKHKGERRVRGLLEDEEEISQEKEAESELAVEDDEGDAEPDEEPQAEPSDLKDEAEAEAEPSSDPEDFDFPDTQIPVHLHKPLPPIIPPKQTPIEDDSEDDTKETRSAKRGKRGKLKKIKEKYKDQDEEDKQLRMKILGSAGTKKESKKSKKDKDAPGKPKDKKPCTPRAPQSNPVDIEDDESTQDLDMLNLLTGQPFPDDELLFALPVVAPYSALTSYKFKIKMTPGLGKRGKAARNALDHFVKNKSTTPRERDLMKAVNDQLMTRNFPGKVKLSIVSK